MKEEVLELYDDEFKQLNRTIIRKVEEIPIGTNIMTSYILIKNDDKYLLEQSTKRKNFKWAIPGGHKLSGESSEEGLIRELKEELNIDKISFTKIDTIKYPCENYIFNIYVSNDILDIKELKFQENEVSKVKWFTKKEILMLIKENKILKRYAYILKRYI